MTSVSVKILVVFCLISTTVLASSCNLFCELDNIQKIRTSLNDSLQLNVGLCHKSQESSESVDCEWDSGALDITRKDRLINITVFYFFASIQYFLFDQKKDLFILTCFKVLLLILSSDTIQSINSVRIII